MPLSDDEHTRGFRLPPEARGFNLPAASRGLLDAAEQINRGFAREALQAARGFDPALAGGFRADLAGFRALDRWRESATAAARGALWSRTSDDGETGE